MMKRILSNQKLPKSCICIVYFIYRRRPNGIHSTVRIRSNYSEWTANTGMLIGTKFPKILTENRPEHYAIALGTEITSLKSNQIKLEMSTCPIISLLSFFLPLYLYIIFTCEQICITVFECVMTVQFYKYNERTFFKLYETNSFHDSKKQKVKKFIDICLSFQTERELAIVHTKSLQWSQRPLCFKRCTKHIEKHTPLT